MRKHSSAKHLQSSCCPFPSPAPSFICLLIVGKEIKRNSGHFLSAHLKCCPTILEPTDNSSCCSVIHLYLTFCDLGEDMAVSPRLTVSLSLGDSCLCLQCPALYWLLHHCISPSIFSSGSSFHIVLPLNFNTITIPGEWPGFTSFHFE